MGQRIYGSCHTGKNREQIMMYDYEITDEVYSITLNIPMTPELERGQKHLFPCLLRTIEEFQAELRELLLVEDYF